MQIDEIALVVKLREQDKSFSEIGDILGFSERTARRRYTSRYEAEGQGKVEDVDQEEPKLGENLDPEDPLDIEVTSHFLPDNNESIERFKPIVTSGNAIIASDWHIPLHDPALANAMINYAHKNGITDTLIIPGDYWTMEAFSSFLPHQPEAAWSNERYEGNLVMKTLLKTFKHVFFSWGNHDFRLTRSLGFKHSFTECMKWAFSALTAEELSRITFSDLDFQEYYPGDGRKYRICHPRNFSAIPLTVPRKLALKYSCSIMTAHSHHCAMGAATNGRDLCIETGGLYKKERTEYIQKSSAHHEWTPGFVAFKGGIPELISPVIGNDKEWR